MITFEQSRLITYLKAVGYGWGKFAASVEAQGACSEAQEKTMRRMKAKVKGHTSHDYSNKTSYDTSHTDGEIMSFGLEI